EEAGELGRELRRLHVVGIGAEALAPPGDVRRSGTAAAASAEPGEPGVLESGAREGAGERLAREVRLPPRGREAPHVGDARDAVRAEQRDEVVERERRMSDRVDDHPRTVAESPSCGGWPSPRSSPPPAVPRRRSTGRSTRASQCWCTPSRPRRRRSTWAAWRRWAAPCRYA